MEFALNGAPVTVAGELAVQLTLNDYLRFHAKPKLGGTKLGCGEGGCGACTVTLTGPDGIARSGNSCLIPLMSVDKMAVTTVEGLAPKGCGDPSKSPSAPSAAHPVQQRLVQFHGTQCGFCTPGMVMQMYASIASVQGGHGATVAELEKKDFLVGNLCRCTGYRPINDAIKSFARDTDVKDDIGHGGVGPVGGSGAGGGGSDAAATFSAPSAYPEFLRQKQDEPAFQTEQWLRPNSLDELKSIFSDAGNVAGNVLVISGHTGHGVYGPDMSALCVGLKRDKRVLQVQRVRELNTINISEEELRIGASVSINRTIDTMTELVERRPELAQLLTAASDHLALIAGHQVRNVGSIGGNIMMVRGRGFASDLTPVMIGLGASVDYLTASGQIVSGADLRTFVSQRTDEPVVLVTVRIPLRPTSFLRTYRASYRARNAYALANASFRLDLGSIAAAANPLPLDATINGACLIFGALGGAPQRAGKAEAMLIGKRVRDVAGALGDVLATIQEEIKIDPSAHFDYRTRQIQVFAFKFFAEICSEHFAPHDRSASSSIHSRGARKTSSTQKIAPVDAGLISALRPAFEPHAKTTALAQAKGDAVFLDDVALPHGALHAALVQIPYANTTYSSLDDSQVRAQLGEEYYGLVLSANIIQNVVDWSKLIRFGASPERTPGDTNPVDEFVLLPPGTPSKFAHQAIAIVLANSQRMAEQAAAAVKIVGLSAPDGVMTNPDEAVASMLPKPMEFLRGDKAKTLSILAEYSGKGLVVHGPFAKSSQAHFYMEPQSAFAVPDEEGGLTLNSATQSVTLTQEAACFVTGLPQNKLHVKFRRLGGGFGGKVTRSSLVACMTAAAAHHVRRAVRLVLPRSVDTSIIGGRQEIVAEFDAAVERNGRIKALRVHIRMGCGGSKDFGEINAMIIAQAIDMVYDLSNALVTVDLKQTHVPPRTATRSPAHLESLMLIETIMDTISNALGLAPDAVREVNFLHPGLLTMGGLSGGMLPPAIAHEVALVPLWKRIKQVSNYDTRQLAAYAFNQQNRWKKRGVAINAAKYLMIRMPGMVGKVDIFRDGTLLVTTSGAEIGQGLHTKVGQVCCATFLSKLGVAPPLESLRFGDFSSEIFPEHKGAGGSTTTEVACYAVEDACYKLIERLQQYVPVVKKANGGKATWKLVVEAAYKGPGVPFWAFESSALGMYKPAIGDLLYDAYGVAVSEVEIDVLTGEKRVIRTDLMYDIGACDVNAAISIGQVEGAFVMGLGQMLLEDIKFDPTTGANLTRNTWDYKVPTIFDIPETFNVHLVDLEGERTSGLWGVVIGGASALLGSVGLPWKPSKGRREFRSSRATGEPPLLLAQSILSATRYAIHAARGGKPEPSLCFPAPLTVETIAELAWKGEKDLVGLKGARA